MSLAGDLRTMTFAELLQWVGTSRKTGVLSLERRSIRKTITLREGIIFSASSNDPRETLGQFLIRDRRITEEKLFDALLRQEQIGRPLGSILISDGVLSGEHLASALQAKAEETIYDIFLWPQGCFQYEDGEQGGVLFQLDMKVTAVVLEGIRRVDEWGRIRKVFPSRRTTFKVQETPEGMEGAEKHLLDLAATSRTLAEISLELRRSEFDTACLLFDLHSRGLITVQDPGHEPWGAETDVVAAINERLGSAQERLQGRQYDAALQAYEEVLALDPLNQQAKEGLIAVMEARGRGRRERAVPPTGVPVLVGELASFSNQKFSPKEGFVLSRINGEWDVQSILKLCPMPEEEALLIFARLLEGRVIELR